MRDEFRALEPGDVFTFYDGVRVVTAIKTDDGRACRLSDGVLFKVQYNRKVDEPDAIDRRYEVAMKDGHAVLVQNFTSTPVKRYVCKSFLVLGSEFVTEHELTLKRAGRGHERSQGAGVLLQEIDRLVSKLHTLTHAAKALHEPESEVFSVLEEHIIQLSGGNNGTPV